MIKYTCIGLHSPSARNSALLIGRSSSSNILAVFLLEYRSIALGLRELAGVGCGVPCSIRSAASSSLLKLPRRSNGALEGQRSNCLLSTDRTPLCVGDVHNDLAIARP